MTISGPRLSLYPVNGKRCGRCINRFFFSSFSFSVCCVTGTLNPALQDRQGRPKRDISTIIHILNDLLCATPQYRRVLNAHAAAAAAAAAAAQAAAATANAVPTASSSTSSSSTGGSSSQRQTPTPMEQEDSELAAAAAQMAAAAALHRKTPGKAGLPTLLLLRGDISKSKETHTKNINT